MTSHMSFFSLCITKKKWTHSFERSCDASLSNRNGVSVVSLFLKWNGIDLKYSLYFDIREVLQKKLL